MNISYARIVKSNFNLQNPLQRNSPTRPGFKKRGKKGKIFENLGKNV